MTAAADQLYEQVLLLRYQAGDNRAFAELVERYHRRLRYYVGRLVGPAGSVDDVLQNVWLIAFRELPRLRHPRALCVWLYRTARNAALGELRNARGWGELTEEPAAPTQDEPEFSPQDAASIHAALIRLRPEHREVLVLRFVEELSYEGIAEVVGCPLGTVRSRIHYAKQALRREMRG